MNYAFEMLSLYVRNVEKAKAFYTEFLGDRLCDQIAAGHLPAAVEQTGNGESAVRRTSLKKERDHDN